MADNDGAADGPLPEGAPAWRPPNDFEEGGEGSAIVGRRVLVGAHGAGTVTAFVRARIGASSHVIRLDAGGTEVKVKLARKGNGKTPWQISNLELHLEVSV